jgi:hypothetical protein
VRAVHLTHSTDAEEVRDAKHAELRADRQCHESGRTLTVWRRIISPVDSAVRARLMSDKEFRDSSGGCSPSAAAIADWTRQL